RAGTIDVKCAGILCSELVLQDDRRVRRDIVRGRGAENNQVDIFGLAPRTLESLLGGGKGEVGRHPVFGGIKALIDTGAGPKLIDDVRPSECRETRRQLRVGYDVLGQIASGGDNLRNAGHEGPLQKGTSRTSYSAAVVTHEWRVRNGPTLIGPQRNRAVGEFPGDTAARCARPSLARRDYEVVHAEMTSTERSNRAMAVSFAKGKCVGCLGGRPVAILHPVFYLSH